MEHTKKYFKKQIQRCCQSKRFKAIPKARVHPKMSQTFLKILTHFLIAVIVM